MTCAYVCILFSFLTPVKRTSLVCDFKTQAQAEAIVEKMNHKWRTTLAGVEYTQSWMVGCK
jgi:hypothetical protein